MGKIRLKKKIRFKAKSIFFIVMILISFFIGNELFYKIKLYTSNEDFIMSLLNDSNHYKKYEKKDIMKKLTNYVFDADLKKPVTLLENMFGYKTNEVNNEEVLKLTKHIKDPNPTVIENPLVYIYNSHQLENYSNSNYEVYNITPNVMMASYLLREKLNNQGIKTIVEESSISEFLKTNNWDYNYSYQASRYYVEEAIRTHTSLKYFIDLHRDSIPKEQSTVVIDNQEYAKVMFVVGLEHDNFQKNLDLVTKLNNRINAKYPGLSRGIIKKSGPNVNGIYNQDLSPNSILIELGGYQNKIEEVLKTVEILSSTLKEELFENKEI